MECPEKFACSAGTNTLTNPWQTCTPGFFCPAGSTVPNDAANACPAGTYSDRDDLATSGECYDCPPGKWCSGGLTVPDADCYPGSYCPGSSVKVTVTGVCACTVDSVNLPACACPASNPTCVDTDTGEIACDIEKTGEQCPAGTYLNRAGAKAASECKICPLGSYCPELMACEVGQTCASSPMTATCPESAATCYYGT